MTREVKHCKHSSGSLEGLDASLPNDCAFCAHEQLSALADALEMILAVECKGPCALERGHATELHDMARSALRAAGRIP